MSQLKVKITLIAIQGGLCEDQTNGDKVEFRVAYAGRAPASVVKLRARSRNLGYFTRIHPGGFEVRKDNWSVMTIRYNYLQIVADRLDLLAEEIGNVMIERIEMGKEQELELRKKGDE